MIRAVDTASISKPLISLGTLRLRMPSSQAFEIIPRGNWCDLSICRILGRISFFTKRLTVSTYICCSSLRRKSMHFSLCAVGL